MISIAQNIYIFIMVFAAFSYFIFKRYVGCNHSLVQSMYKDIEHGGYSAE